MIFVRFVCFAVKKRMADVFTQAKRSEAMSRIRGRGNKDTELALAICFRTHRITGWRRNQPVIGKTDSVFLLQGLTESSDN